MPSVSWLRLRGRATHSIKRNIHQGSKGGGRKLVRRDGTREGFLDVVLPTGDPVGGTKAFMAVVVPYHENIKRGGLDRTSELLRGVQRVGRGRKRKDRFASNVFETEVFVRPFNFGGVLGSGGCGGGVDRRCSSVGEVRRHGHGVVVGHGQAAKTLG